MGFNSGFKGLIYHKIVSYSLSNVIRMIKSSSDGRGMLTALSRVWLEYSKERVLLEDLDVEETVILKWISAEL